MDQPTFLDRRPLGIPNYLAIALVAVLMIAAIPRGTRRALETNTNKVEDWLPATYSESADLAWFRNQFGNEAFVLVSWDGCTLGETERLNLLAEKLAAEPLTAEIADAAHVAPHSERRLFARVITGPGMIDQLAGKPANLDRKQAIERLSGAFIGPAAIADDDSTRTTCLVAYLSPQTRTNNRTMRLAIDRLIQIAETDCGLKADDLHLGGPPVDNVAIDIEGEKVLKTLASLSGLVGLLLAYACFRSIRLTGMVLVVATLAAGASLAMVFYYGAFEVLALGARSPRLGKLDAILMSMPAVVYVLGLSGAIHMVNYYRDATESGGRRGAVERAVRMALVPCAVASLTTAIGLASLASSDILPIEKFGVFSAIGVLIALALLFAVLPVALHRFAPPLKAPTASDRKTGLPGWGRWFAELVCRRHGWVALGASAVMLLFALGLPRIESSVKLVKLLSPEADLVQDYGWLETHLGHLVPMEVVVAVPPKLRRGVNEHPEASGTHYAMTTFERLTLARRISQQLESLEPVSRVLNAATFAPGDFDTRSPSNRRTHDYVVSEAIDANRYDLQEFLRWETSGDQTIPATSRELWRASARIAALDDIDYGQFVAELRGAVEPLLAVYRARSELVGTLAFDGKQLAGATLCFVVPQNYSASDAMFANLLREAGINTVSNGHRGKLWTVPANELAKPSEQQLQRLDQQDIIVTLNAEVADQLAQLNIPCLALTDCNVAGSNDLTATYTGVVPLVYKTQRELLVSLQQSLVMASVLIAVVLMVLLRSIGGGLAAMIPNLFPIVVIFGGLGWFGIHVDIGIMMTASVALGVAVDDTIHFVSWFRRGLSVGLSRYDAVIESYERCATAMVQTTLIAGLGLAVFAFSTFTPTQQFGYLMVTILAAALVGDLILLPALLVGPLGALFPASARVSSEVMPSSANLSVPTTPTTVREVPETPRRAQDECTDPTPAATIPFSAPVTKAQPAVPPTAKSELPPVQPPTEAASGYAPPPDHTPLSPTNAALRNKLRSFRRGVKKDESAR